MVEFLTQLLTSQLRLMQAAVQVLEESRARLAGFADRLGAELTVGERTFRAGGAIFYRCVGFSAWALRAAAAAAAMALICRTWSARRLPTGPRLGS